MTLLIGTAIWVAFLALCGLVWWRQSRKKPQVSAEQLWEEATPEERDEATRQRGWSSVWSAGNGPSGGAGPGC